MRWSGLGPVRYIVAAPDLQASHTGNIIIKFADDTYLIVTSVNSATCQDELDRVRQWAADNTTTSTIAHVIKVDPKCQISQIHWLTNSNITC